MRASIESSAPRARALSPDSFTFFLEVVASAFPRSSARDMERMLRIQADGFPRGPVRDALDALAAEFAAIAEEWGEDATAG